MIIRLVLVEILTLGCCDKFNISRRNLIDKLVGGIFPHASARLLRLTMLA